MTTAIKTEHTPTPWHKRKALKPIDGAFDYAISAQSASVLAETFGLESKGLFINAEANADLIVRAVNSFEAMKQALENLSKRYCDLVNCGDCGFWEPEDEKEIIASRAALKLANGEQP